jgi:hypothetical protein
VYQLVPVPASFGAQSFAATRPDFFRLFQAAER